MIQIVDRSSNKSDLSLSLLLWKDALTVTEILNQKSLTVTMYVDNLTIKDFSVKPVSSVFLGVGKFDIIKMKIDPGLIPFQTIRSKIKQFGGKIRLEDINALYLIANKKVDVLNANSVFDIGDVINSIQSLSKFMLQYLYLRRLFQKIGEFYEERKPYISPFFFVNNISANELVVKVSLSFTETDVLETYTALSFDGSVLSVGIDNQSGEFRIMLNKSDKMFDNSFILSLIQVINQSFPSDLANHLSFFFLSHTQNMESQHLVQDPIEFLRIIKISMLMNAIKRNCPNFNTTFRHDHGSFTVKLEGYTEAKASDLTLKCQMGANNFNFYKDIRYSLTSNVYEQVIPEPVSFKHTELENIMNVIENKDKINISEQFLLHKLDEFGRLIHLLCTYSVAKLIFCEKIEKIGQETNRANQNGHPTGICRTPKEFFIYSLNYYPPLKESKQLKFKFTAQGLVIITAKMPSNPTKKAGPYFSHFKGSYP